VLATIKTVDFLYVCDGHLEDPGFATKVGDTNDSGGAAKPGLSTEEIAKVKQEWEERQKKKKQEKEKAKGDEKETDEKAATKDKEVEKPSSSGALTPSATPSSPTPTHERYTLHRDMFALRLAEHRRRRQAAQAKELAPRLPGAPRESLQP